MSGADPRPSAVVPIAAAEFAALMAPLGPWPPDRRVAVALSGGADSTALAFLVSRWAGPAAPPLALVVDHGIRPGSDAEAWRAASRARGFGCDARVLRCRGLVDGPALQARARAARHALLAAATADAGRLDLLLAHHRDDQAETRIMRGERGSGADGLAGMAVISELDRIRLVRPLLMIAGARLRATARAAGLAWHEDPSNADRRFTRGRLRAATPPDSHADGTEATNDAADQRRRRAERAARFVAAHATVREDGVVVLDTGVVPAGVLASLLRAVSGRPYAPAAAAVARLAPALRPATLGGVRIGRAPARLGGGFLLAREPAAMASSVPATVGACWDGRFRIVAGGAASLPRPCGWTLGALGDEARTWRDRSPLPAAALATLPALRDADGQVRAVPCLAAAAASNGATGGGLRDRTDNFHVMFSPRNPLLPSFFTNGPHHAVSCGG